MLGTTPAIFGLACAAYILCQLAGQPIAPEPHFRVPVRQLGGVASVSKSVKPWPTAAAADTAAVFAIVGLPTTLPAACPVIPLSRCLPHLAPPRLPQPKQFQGIFDSLYEREELRFGSADSIGVDAEEVEALVRAGGCSTAVGCR